MGLPSLLIPGITSLHVIKLWGIHFTLYTPEWKHVISEVNFFPQGCRHTDLHEEEEKKIDLENFNIWARIRNFIGGLSNTRRREKYSLDVFATPAMYLGNRLLC